MGVLKNVLILNQIIQIFAVLSFTVDEKFYDCNNGSLRYYNLSSVKITALNDTYTVINGSIKVLKLVSNPWPFAMIGERYDRGRWNLMLQRKLSNFCDHILNPLELQV